MFGEEGERADGLASLGLFEDAWEVLESLHPKDRVQPAVFAVCLVICRELERWEMGIELARLIGPLNAKGHREAAGRFRLADALALCAAGKVAEAREAVATMSSGWPEGRLVALEAKALAGIW